MHSPIRGNKRRNREQDLVSRAAHDIPEALADEGGHGALAVGRQGVCGDAFAGTAAAFVGVAPAADVPSAVLELAHAQLFVRMG